MTWQEFVAAVEADGITGETRLASVHWTARAGLVVQTQPERVGADAADWDGGTVDPGTPYEPVPQPVYTKHDELGEVEIHD